MTLREIENYLAQKHTSLDSNIGEEIEKLRKNAISMQLEGEANYFWCLMQIVKTDFLEPLAHGNKNGRAANCCPAARIFCFFRYSTITSAIILAPSLKLFWKSKHSTMVWQS